MRPNKKGKKIATKEVGSMVPYLGGCTSLKKSWKGLAHEGFFKTTGASSHSLEVNLSLVKLTPSPTSFLRSPLVFATSFWGSHPLTKKAYEVHPSLGSSSNSTTRSKRICLKSESLEDHFAEISESSSFISFVFWGKIFIRSFKKPKASPKGFPAKYWG